MSTPDPSPATARQAPTVRLDDHPTPADDSPTEHGNTTAPGSILQGALEILAPIAAFLIVGILTAPLWEAVTDEVSAPLGIAAALVLRVWLAYKAARIAARWASRKAR